MIAGLEEISDGTLRIGDRVVNDVPPKDRDIAMVFQSYALYPHMTVRDNMAFGLKLRKVPKADIEKRVADAAGILSLEKYLDRKPKELSGGQRQRVALGRAIVREPAVFLMDEPLSNLDAKLRVQTRAEIARIHQRLGTTMVYVTHDQIEAMTMGERVAVMNDGQLEQVDAPQELYDHPANLFVAGFIGSPPMNLVRARVEHGADGLELVVGSQRLALPFDVPDALRERAGGAAIVVGVRPEAIDHVPAGVPEREALEAPVLLVESLGSDLLVHTELDAPAVLTRDQLEVAREVGGDPAADLARARFTARLTPDVRVAPGDRVRLGVDVDRLHYFDPDTTLALT